MQLRFPVTSRRTTVFAIALVLLTSIAVLLLLRLTRSAEAAPFVDESYVRKLDLPANDLVVDPNTQTIYASIPSSDFTRGNRIAPLNPVTGALGIPILVGSEPKRMAISDNGQYIYVELQGSSAIRRVDVATRIANLTISLGNDFSSGPVGLNDLVVQPGTSTVLGLNLTSASVLPGTVIFDSVSRRPNFVQGHDGVLGFKNSDPNRLYALSTSSLLKRMTVNANGVTEVSTANVSAAGAIQIVGDRLYAANGKVIDPETTTVFGTFTGANLNSTTPFAIDANVQRVFFATSPVAGTGSPRTVTIRVFDQQTFLSLGTLDIPNVFGTPTKLVRWGSNGLAFCTTEGQVYLIQTSLIPSADPIPSPSPTPFSSPTPTPTPPINQAFIRKIPLSSSDIIYDPITSKIYASQPSTAGPNGNSVTPLDPFNQDIGPSVLVGSEPNKLALSDNGQFLYVALDGTAAVRRIDVASQTPDQQFYLGPTELSNGPAFVEDMEVLPGAPSSVAVSLMDITTGPSGDGVVIFDNGVPRPIRTRRNARSNFLEFSNSADTLFGFEAENSDWTVRKMAVTPSGVTVTSITPAVVNSFRNDFEFANNRLYFTTGRVYRTDTVNLQLEGTFPAIGFGNLVLPTPGVTFFINGATFSDSAQDSTVQIRAFDQNTFTQLGTINIDGVNGRVRRLIRWGANGLAFCTSGGQVFLVQTSLRPSTEPVPTPTPTPSPTPFPTPIPVPTPGAGELRQLTLTTADLVVDPNTQTIFASVPAASGPNANSITPIDPAAGTIGTSVFVGTEPRKMAISNDGSTIYVGLNGANAVRRFDVAGRTAGQQFTLGNNQSSDPYIAGELAIPPGQPNVVAVARLAGFSPNGDGVAVFDNGVQRPNVAAQHAFNLIRFSASPSVFYGVDTSQSSFTMTKFGLGSCGPIAMSSVKNLFSGFNLDYKMDNGAAYGSSGRIVDPEIENFVGTFRLSADSQIMFAKNLVAPEVRARRVYFIIQEGGSTFLRVFDSKTFLQIGELRLPGVTGTLSSLVRWGANGLAFRNNSNQVFLLQNALIGGVDPEFTVAPPPPAPAFSSTVTVNSSDDPGGVTINVTGSVTTSGLTNAAGVYTINGIPPCAEITVTPTKTNYVFSPTSTTVTNPINANIQFVGSLKTISFSTASTFISEFARKVTVDVFRNTGLSDPASVEFETNSGTASDRSDYNASFGTIQFAAGEQTKQIQVLLTDDALQEGTETFTIKLKNPNGAALGNSTFTVNIVDNDSSPATANPLSSAQFFVRQHYQDFLNRNGDDDISGSNFWVNEINSCGSISDPASRANCFATKRINVSAAFFLSIENLETGYLVHRLYTSSYAPSAARPLGLPRLAEFQRDSQAISLGVVVGSAGWEQRLEQNKAAFVLNWVQRAEFLVAHPMTETADQFVDSLFLRNGVTPTPSERSAAIAAFGAGGNSGRAQALRSVAESPSVFNKQYNSAFVLMQYFGYLRRNPDDAPDTNFDGYQFWLNKLNSFGNYVDAEMVKAFLQSTEYQSRFGPANFDLSQ